MSGPPRSVARFLLWLLLGGWIGAMLLFLLVVTPTAFRILPSSELAGRIVASSLEALNLYGALTGVALALLAIGLGRRPLLVGLPLLLSAGCLFSQFGVSASLAELRAAAFVVGDGLARERFDWLHKVSVGLFGLTWLGAVLLLACHVRADGRDSARPAKN